MVIVECPLCGKPVPNDGSLCEQAVFCPHCGGQFQMPAFKRPEVKIVPQSKKTPKHSKSVNWVLPILAICAALSIYGGPFVYDLATKPQRVEATATRLLQARHDSIRKFELPQGPELSELVGGNFGKHRFKVLESNWDIQRNHESTAYPYSGVIFFKFIRLATIAHPSREAAEGDAKFYVANYSSIQWMPNEKLAEVSMHMDPPFRTLKVDLLFDQSGSKWVERSRKIE